MAYRIAGIDVHKKMVAVAIADVEIAETWRFERRQIGTSPNELRALAEWLVEREVDEVVMESTAQYWRPVWDALERFWQPRQRQRPGAPPRAGALHLAQAQSNEGPRGRKQDFPDAERLVKRLVAQELRLSFVPDVVQRLWRTVTRRKDQVTCNRVQLRNGSSVCSRKRTSRSPVWSRICSDLVGDGCCAPSRMAKRIRRGWPRSAVRGSMRRPISSAMRSGCVRTCIPFTGTCSR